MPRPSRAYRTSPRQKRTDRDVLPSRVSGFVLRRIAARPVRPGEGPLTERTAGVQPAQSERVFMCRFSDAGNDGPCTRWGGRRLKSAKAMTVPMDKPTPPASADYRGSDLVVCPACSIAWGWKSPIQPDGGEGLAKHKGGTARWRLKAVQSKTAT